MGKGLCVESWVDVELKTADFGDRRLNSRLGDVLEAFGSKPSLSILLRYCFARLFHGLHYCVSLR